MCVCVCVCVCVCFLILPDLEWASAKIRTSLVAQMVKRLSTMWETWVPSLGWEDLLEKEMAIHSSILAWKIPWTKEPATVHVVVKSWTYSKISLQRCFC